MDETTRGARDVKGAGVSVSWAAELFGGPDDGLVLALPVSNADSLRVQHDVLPMVSRYDRSTPGPWPPPGRSRLRYEYAGPWPGDTP